MARSFLWCSLSDENGQQKWVTQDQATIVTQHGRIVKTLLGGDNLLEVNNSRQTRSSNRIKSLMVQAGRASWAGPSTSRSATPPRVLFFRWDGTDTVTPGSDETQVRVLDEEVKTDRATWHNRFWVDEEGQIRQSLQYLGADFFPVKATLIKAAKS